MVTYQPTATGSNSTNVSMSYFGGYNIAFVEDDDGWMCAVYELGVMGYGKSKREAMRDFALALVDMMDSYKLDGLEL